MRRICIGIVGCGEVAHKHIKALRKIKQAEVRAVADIVRERAKRFAKLYNIDIH